MQVLGANCGALFHVMRVSPPCIQIPESLLRALLRLPERTRPWLLRLAQHASMACSG